jgi:hypothetical protein
LLFATIGGAFHGEDAQGQDYRTYFSGASHQWHEYAASYHTGETLDDETPDLDVGALDVRSHQVGHRRKIFIGEKGYCGLVPDCANTGDIVAVFFGCDLPVILRELGINQFAFIGEAYVQGIMDGEAIEALDKGEIVPVEFKLI